MKRRYALIGSLSKHIDKIIIGASYCVLFLLLLSLSPGVLYQERLIREGRWQETRGVGNERFSVNYALNTGGDKPLISSSSGDELLSIDGFKSSVRIDNSENRSFWNHAFRNVVEGTTVIRHNMLWDNYQLMQMTTLRENMVHIDYRIKSYKSEENFDLTLNLCHEYQEFSLLKIDNDYVNDNYRRENKKENQPELTYAVLVQTHPPPDNIENASRWAELTYSFENLALGKSWSDPLVEETISYVSWEEIPEPENLP